MFVVSGFYEDGLAVSDAIGEERPETVSDAAAGVAHEDTGVDFDHPSGEMTT
ncbi:hypothetical protein GCM10023195_55280 [Actinoallomurus liliacearum]|uniref:Uncharacterized protein n=1 Tax=Actinoallomurus liliacearum TaxID=1080073 RepID=A0ABP8TNX6_9ACTN